MDDEMRKLEAIEAYFQTPDMNLEEAIKKHEEALKVAKGILEYLDKAESSLQKLTLRVSGGEEATVE